jgi:hypothetical protein
MRLDSLASIVLASLLLTPRAAPQDGGQGSRPEPRGEQRHEGPDTALGACMERLEDTLKAVRRSLREEARRPEALRLVLELQKATVEARGYEPALAAKVNEAERPAFVADYRRMLIDLQRHELDLESALLDGDANAIQAAFEAVRSFEDRGHERFSEDED